MRGPLGDEGSGDGSRLFGTFSNGYLWSSTPNSNNSRTAWHLYFDHGGFFWTRNARDYGQFVRPVRDAD